MSDSTEYDAPDSVNQQLVLISGESTTGKSASLRNIRNQDRWLYLNFEAGKSLPFKNKFREEVITDPYDIYEAFEATMPGGELYDDVDGIITDSLTFMMDMFESLYIIPSNDTQKAWGSYQQFFKKLMQYYVASSEKACVFLAHTRYELDDVNHRMRAAVPIKGALKNNGVESYFSTVVSTKTVPVKSLEGQDDNLLTITPQEEALGFKHVFQTQLTKETVGERIRSPMGMFDTNQTYMDNDAQMLLDLLSDYYS